MSGGERRGWLRVGLGPEAARWTPRDKTAKVLLVVHNVTSATRLLDVLPLFDGDLRVSCFVTCTESSVYQAGIPELFAELELPIVPWEQAKAAEFDLIISASYGGEIQKLSGKLAVLSHGMGYNKILHREPGAGSRALGVGAAFGLTAEWLLHEGEPIAEHTVLSHPEQLARLAESCPPAASTAVYGGDPCYDRLLEALPHRERYRAALRLEPGQRLVVLNSTWNPGSVFGDRDDILPLLLHRLGTELPLDEYRVAAVLHSNIWHGHGPGQIRRWLKRATRAGMLLIPPLDGWRQTLAAADILIGDHGSVSYYAAAIGLPVLLGAFPEDELDPRSPVAEFGRVADRLDVHLPLRSQLDAGIRGHRPERFAELTKLVSSDPGSSATLLRRLFYQALGIAEPSFAARLDGLAPPSVEFTPPTSALRALVERTDGSAAWRVTRYPESADPDERSSADHTHVVAREETDDFGSLGRADLVLSYSYGAGCRSGSGSDRDSADAAADWLSRSARTYPHAAMVAACTAPGRATARYRDGRVFSVHCVDCRCDPAPLVSALLAHLELGDQVPRELAVHTGSAVRTVRITP